MSTSTRPLFEVPLVRRAIREAFVKLSPRHQFRNPVLFVVEAGSLLSTVLFVLAVLGVVPENPGFVLSVSLWLWFTVLFANFAEAMAEGRGKAQADSLRSARKDVQAKQLSAPRRDAKVTVVSAARLRKDDVVLVEAGDQIPGDGEIIEGVASVP
jgi:K+-transporting ATPase ATPase B chain